MYQRLHQWHYGIDHDPKRFEQNWLRPKTSIPELYLTGQDILTCGVGGAMMAGVMSAVSVLGWRNYSLLNQFGIQGSMGLAMPGFSR